MLQIGKFQVIVYLQEILATLVDNDQKEILHIYQYDISLYALQP